VRQEDVRDSIASIHRVAEPPCGREKYLVMAGVMDELRLDFGSRDVLFVSFSSEDFYR
jgi:hypothetical protein